MAVFSWATNSIGGMQNAIMYYSILMLVAGVLCFLFMENDKPVPKTPEEKAAQGNPLNMKDFMEVAKMPRVWLCGLLGICNYSALIFHGYVTAYLSAAFEIPDSTVATLSVVRTYMMMMLGAFAAGFIADKIGSRIKFIQYGFIGMTIFALAYVVIPAGKSSIPLIVATFVVYGLCLYAIKALYFATIDEVMVPKRLAGTASGVQGRSCDSMKLRRRFTASRNLSMTAGTGSTSQILRATSLFCSPEKSLTASSTASCCCRKSRIFPYGLVSLRTRLVREKAWMSPWYRRFLSTYKVFKYGESNPVRSMSTTMVMSAL